MMIICFFTSVDKGILSVAVGECSIARCQPARYMWPRRYTGLISGSTWDATKHHYTHKPPSGETHKHKQLTLFCLFGWYIMGVKTPGQLPYKKSLLLDSILLCRSYVKINSTLFRLHVQHGNVICSFGIRYMYFLLVITLSPSL